MQPRRSLFSTPRSLQNQTTQSRHLTSPRLRLQCNSNTQLGFRGVNASKPRTPHQIEKPPRLSQSKASRRAISSVFNPLAITCTSSNLQHIHRIRPSEPTKAPRQSTKRILKGSCCQNVTTLRWMAHHGRDGASDRARHRAMAVRLASRGFARARPAKPRAMCRVG